MARRHPGPRPQHDAPRRRPIHQFETSSFVPGREAAPSSSDRPENDTDALYRLLPLLSSEGIDEMLLTDIVEWCNSAWPLGAWDDLFRPRQTSTPNFQGDPTSM